jgi:hypothetical protein
MAPDWRAVTRVEKTRKSLRQDQPMTGRTADSLDPADQIDVRADQREIEALAGADVPIGSLTVVESNTGV